jgi:hypothetical protein
VHRHSKAATALCSEFRVYAAGRLKAELQTIQSAIEIQKPPEGRFALPAHSKLFADFDVESGQDAICRFSRRLLDRIL